MTEIELLPLIDYLPETHKTELKNLINEMRSKKFKESKSLSAYIIKNKIGYKYPNISGRLLMEKNGEKWDFDGAFPTEIYTLICLALDLKSQKSGARALKFTPQKDL